jgi:hypothetical protein
MLTDMDAELAQLQAARGRAAVRVDQIDAEERAATVAVREASDELIRLERAAAAGEKISVAARSKAEEALLQAKTAALAPWAERREAARQTLRDAERAIGGFTRDHLAELVENDEAGCRAAAAKFDGLLRDLIDAHRAREEAAQRLGATLARVRPAEFGDIALSRAGEVVRAAEALLRGGGEAAGLVDRSRPPWSVLLAADESADAADELAGAPA